MAKSKPEDKTDDINPNDEAVEIIQKANDEAAEIVSDANDEATEIINKANDEAEGVVNDANQKADETISGAEDKALEAIEAADVIAKEVLDKANAVADGAVSNPVDVGSVGEGCATERCWRYNGGAETGKIFEEGELIPDDWTDVPEKPESPE